MRSHIREYVILYMQHPIGSVSLQNTEQLLLHWAPQKGFLVKFFKNTTCWDWRESAEVKSTHTTLAEGLSSVLTLNSHRWQQAIASALEDWTLSSGFRGQLHLYTHALTYNLVENHMKSWITILCHLRERKMTYSTNVAQSPRDKQRATSECYGLVKPPRSHGNSMHVMFTRKLDMS